MYIRLEIWYNDLVIHNNKLSSQVCRFSMHFSLSNATKLFTFVWEFDIIANVGCYICHNIWLTQLGSDEQYVQ